MTRSIWRPTPASYMRCDKAPKLARSPIRARAASASSWWTAAAGVIVSCSALLAADGQLQLVHQQRYSMGTMFDIVVYHRSASEARRAIGVAMTEIERLDRVMSHYRTDSDLSRLVKGARAGYVPV